MAISTSFLLSTHADANNTSTVVADTSLPQNCHTVIIYNPDGTNDVYVGVGFSTSAGTIKINISYICSNKV